MTTHMTKTWFDGKNIVTQEIPETEIYKHPWVELTEDEIYTLAAGGHAVATVKVVNSILKAKNT
jgi:hypothetical protein